MKTLIFIKYFFAIIGFGMLVGSFFLYQKTMFFLESAITTEGVVTELVRSRSSSDSSYTYAPVVKFKTSQDTTIEFTSTTSSNPPSYSRGEQIEVLYDPIQPHSAKINSFFSLWGGSVIVGGIGAVFFLIGFGIIFLGIRKARNKEYLLQRGVRINTQFQSVSRNTRMRVNGRNPYMITSQWQDPTTTKIHVFESENIWFDPEQHINSETIVVYIEAKNPSKYHMDISFLPQLAED
ncbi:MAG: DUF3592 domain-containing protein [Sulfuriflexus sp.]|nr:DUF3592 domain-containing protein [Sulfuriflexus sp.]